MPRPLRVFLCHSSNDKPAVRELYQKLRAETWIQPWLDEEELYPGQDWNMEIEKAVEAADAILVCLSKGSITKEGYIQRELRIVLDFADYKPEGTLYIIPVRLEECEPPRRLRAWQYADYFEGQRDRAFQRLLVSLKRRADALGLPGDEVERKQIEESKKRETEDAAQAEREAKEKEDREAAAKAKREKEAKAKAKAEREAGSQPRSKFISWVSANSLSFIFSGISFIVLLFIYFGGKYYSQNNPTLTETPSVAPSETPKPPTPTKTKIPSTPTATPTLAPGATMISEQDGMVMIYVPAGTFTMGSDTISDEQPIHQVFLDAYWIYQTEVTNKQYKACVDAGICELPSNTDSSTRANYYGNPEFDNFPVLYVNWDKANRYCEVWAKGDLPTEAQWEKAARGTDGRTYPWGNEAPSANVLNYNSNVGDTTEVGKYPNGASFYGAYDMAGNVWEWVNDYYQSDYYATLGGNVSNPQGPASGDSRVLRGGSWGSNVSGVRSANRLRFDPSLTDINVGFRCSRGTSP
ncbi:MAG: SUMF1/EgtB/PvdO family nonheme iron enzyme [Anaerolineales bacterium]|nr:SUMF1/EgtB/PvdO family nonheme iron enzyme [Anaerolineales bacterium]